MDNQQEQSQYILQFVDQASTVKDRSSLETIVVQATSHRCLFAFSEILSALNLLQLQGSEVSSQVDLLRLFAYGTWRECKSNADVLPVLMPEQVLKLKQLTVLTLAETNKVLSYDMLLGELEVSNVRELEDFLINDCMYSGIVKGKLDQSQRCFQVQYAAGRDPVPGKVGSMISTLNNWLAISNSLLTTIEEKIEWATEMSKLDEDHEKEVKERIDKAKEHLKKPQNTQSHCSWQLKGKFGDFNDEIDDEEDYNFLHKRRKSPHYYGQSKASYS